MWRAGDSERKSRRRRFLKRRTKLSPGRIESPFSVRASLCNSLRIKSVSTAGRTAGGANLAVKQLRRMATLLESNFLSLDSQLNSSSTPLAQRFRALFTLKSLGGPRAIEIIGKGASTRWKGRREGADRGHRLRWRIGIAGTRARVLPGPDQRRSSSPDLAARTGGRGGAHDGPARGASFPLIRALELIGSYRRQKRWERSLILPLWRS